MALINFGENVGKLAVIVNVIDNKRVLIDGPSTVNGVPRQVMPLKRLSITSIKCNISPGARITALVKAYNAAEVPKKWAESSWAKGIAKRSAKAKLTDFDRFKLLVARKTVSPRTHTCLLLCLEKAQKLSLIFLQYVFTYSREDYFEVIYIALNSHVISELLWRCLIISPFL